MRRILTLPLVLLSVFLLVSACSKDETSSPSGNRDLVGIWKSEVVADDIETIIDFNILSSGQYNLYRTVRIGGELSQDETIAESGTYEVEGGNMIMTSNSGETTTNAFTVTGNSLTIDLWGKTWVMEKR